MFQIENCRSLDELRPLVNTLAHQWKELIPPSLRRAFISWICRMVAPDKGLDMNRVDVENLSEVQVMLATRIKQWERELIEKGREEGIEKGVLTGEAAILRRLLHLRFGPLPAWVDDKIGQVQRAQLEQWSERVLDAATLDAVFA